MRRIAGLLSKEVWHHAGVLVLVGLFIGVVQGILLLGALVGPRTITMLEPHATFMRVFLPLLALALGHRLVVREYYAKTQRFLEALPVHRLEVLAVKLVLGLVVLGVAVTLSLTCAAALAAVKEPLTGWWLILIFVRSQVFALTIWSVFFGMGLLGRWRVPIYLAGGLTLTFLDQGTAFDVSRFGPFALVGERIVLERLSMPWVEIGVSLAIAAFMIALGVILGLVDEGSVAESLAKPMSRRERIAVGVVLALALIAWEAVDPKPDVAAFAFSGDTVVRRDGLSILYLEPAHQSEAEALADAIAPDLAHLRRALGYEAVGPVHVASFPALAANEREAVALDEPEDGVLVRADFTDAAFDRDAFRAWLLERVIEHATDGRAAFEPDAWVAVGSAALLAHAPPDLALAAFYRRARRPRYEALERAFRTEERFGPEVFRALAASAAVAFVDAHGEDAWWAFAREVLAPPAPGVFAMLGPSTRERLEARVDLGAFEASWAARLDAARLDASRPDDADLPRARAWTEVVEEEGRLRTVRWGVRFAAAPPVGATCALAHAPLGPFDEVVEPSEVLREEVLCDALAVDGERLIARYGAHDRVLLAVELEPPDGPRVRLLAERRELDDVRALYLKELRSLWPFLFLTGLLMSGDLLTRPLTERLDEQTWEGIASYVRAGEDGSFGWILALLAGFVAYAAFPREHDERTIHYLYALPVRRPWVFVAKVAAGLTILWTGVLMLLATDTLQSVWNPQSFEGGHWRADLALANVGLQLAFCSLAYAHGLLASVFRLFGVLPYALVLLVAAIFEDVYPPAAWIDPSELLTARYEGTTLVIAWVPWIAHLFVAAVAMAMAYAAWMGPAESIGQGLAKAQASLVGKLAFGCGTMALGVGVLVLAAVVSQMDVGGASVPVDEDRVVETPSLATHRRTTAHYELTWPVSHEARALALIADVDPIHQAIQRELGADAGPVLVADLTEVSSEHLGISSWTHIRVGLVGETDPIRLRHTFAHETVHAFQHRLSDERQGDARRAAFFFGEGSAEEIAYRVAPNEPAHRQARVVAAASWTRLRMTSDDLLDADRLRARFDTSLVYSLGERWASALTRACGEHAIGDALRAMAREGAPRDLGPRAFWQDTLRASDCDLASVDAVFAMLMEEDATELAAAIDALPRLGGGVVGRDGGAVQMVSLLDRDPPAGALFFVRLRADPKAEDTETVGARGQLDPTNPRRVTYRVPGALVPARRFQLQHCVLDDPRGWPFCETWQWASAP